MEEMLKKQCDDLREQIKAVGTTVLALKAHSDFAEEDGYVGQHAEMLVNIMLSYRHLEDARMRIGKVIQAVGDGVSKYDKPEGKSE